MARRDSGARKRHDASVSAAKAVMSGVLTLLLACGSVPTQAFAETVGDTIVLGQTDEQTSQDGLTVDDGALELLSDEPAEAPSTGATDEPGGMTDPEDAIASELLLVTQDAIAGLADGQFTFTNDDGTYTFSLDVDDNATITQFKGDATKLTIPEQFGTYTVVKIDSNATGKGAFQGNTELQTIAMPDTVVEIGANAFRQCSVLSEVSLSKALKRINASAFANCSALQSVVIPEGTTTIGDSAFAKCTALKQVSMPSTVTTIGVSSFNGCTSLGSIVIPESVTTIGNTAFSSCTSLENVSFFTVGSTKEPSIRTLGTSAFGGCAGLRSITIPASLESCTGGPFSNCINLKEVRFEGGTTRVASNLLANCPGIESIVLPEGITTVGDSAFKSCVALTNVTLPSSLTSIAANAFSSCVALPSITFPDALQKLGDSAFKGCTSLPSIGFPDSLTQIGTSTFEGSGLQSVLIPATVTKLGSSAFKDCVSLRKAEVMDGITQLGDSVFYGCELLSELTLPNSLTSIGARAFRGCASLRMFEVPQSVKTLGNEAFYDCDGLQSFVSTNTVTSLGRSIFYDCDALVDVSLGSGIKEIPATAFRHCDKLAEIVIPRSVTTIGTDAFIECTNLSSVYTTDALTSIASGAFSYPKRVTIYGVAGSYAQTYAAEKGINFQPANVEATSIELAPAEVALRKGEKQQISAEIAPVNYTGAITWESSNPLVATVSESGLVQAVGVGSATITINVGSKKATLGVAVTQGVTSLSLNTRSLRLEGGQAYQLVEKVLPDDATNTEVVWSSSDEAVASVTPTGRVRGLRAGSATITCMSADGTQKKATCAVTVTSDVTVATDVSGLESGHPYANANDESWLYTLAGASSLSVTFDARTNVERGADFITVFDDGDQVVGSFTGDDLAGKTIDVPGDTVRIRLSANESNSEWGFKVAAIRQSGIVSSVKLDNNALSMLLGSNSTLSVNCSPAEAASRVVWKSSDETVATVSAQGKVTAIKAGVATITASVGSKFDSCEVTVIAPVAISGAVITAIPAVYYTGEEIAPKPVVTYRGATLKEFEDYTVTYQNNVNPGTAKVIVTGMGYYTGEKTATFRINDKRVNTLSAKAKSKNVQCVYNASQATPTDANVVVSNAVGAVSFSNASTDATAMTFEVGPASGAVTVPKGTQPGTYNTILSVTAAGDDTYKEKSVTVAYTITVAKMANTVALVSKKSSVSCVFDPNAVTATTLNVTASNAQGALTFANASSNSTARRFQVDASTGKVSVPQGVAVGTYPVIIKAMAAGNSYYDAGLATTSYNVVVGKRANPLTVKKLATSVSTPFKEGSVTTLASNVTVTGAQGAVTYTNVSTSAAAKKLTVNGTTGRVSVPKGTKAGSYAVKVKVSAAGNNNYSAKSVTVSYKISVTKIANTMTARASTKTVSAKSVAKKAQVVSPITVSGAKGKVTYKKSSGSAKLTINASTGKITVKKGTKKGTYTAKILVSAAGNTNYKAVKKTIQVQVTVR